LKLLQENMSAVLLRYVVKFALVYAVLGVKQPEQACPSELEPTSEYSYDTQVKLFQDNLKFHDTDNHSFVALEENFFSKTEADELMEVLYNTLPWEHTYYNIDGKLVRGPRKMAWFADGADWSYSFSLNHVPGIPVSPWTKQLLDIREKIRLKSGIDYNSVLANLYEEPEEHSAWHSDDDPWLGYPEPSDIVSVSFGEAREFMWRPKANKEDVTSVFLNHGSLGVMGGHFQKWYQHSVPGVAKQTSYRINLTFRRILYPERKPEKSYWHS